MRVIFEKSHLYALNIKLDVPQRLSGPFGEQTERERETEREIFLLPGIKHISGGEIFRTPPDRPCGPPILLYNVYRFSFSGVKLLARGVDHPSSSSAKVKERVELHLYSPSGLTWFIIV
jgi:hypothetical protein